MGGEVRPTGHWPNDFLAEILNRWFSNLFSAYLTMNN